MKEKMPVPWFSISAIVLIVAAVFYGAVVLGQRRAAAIAARDPAYVAAIAADLERTPLVAGDIVIYFGGWPKIVDQLVIREQPWLFAPAWLAPQLDGVVRYKDDPVRWAQFARTLVTTGCRKAGVE